MTVIPGHEPSVADSGLVSRAVGGDERAWELIVSRHTTSLQRLGRSYRLSTEEISDALQDTWLCAVCHIRALRDPARLGAWLAMIMRRACLKLLRRRRGRELLVADPTRFDAVDESVDVERDGLAAELSSILHEASSQLPTRQRAIVREIAFDDPTYGQLADRLSMPQGSLGPTRKRALHRLRQIIGETHGTDYLRSA